MNIIDIINKKRVGKILSNEEIKYVIDNYLNGTIKDYQMSSLLMAIAIKGMTHNEILNLTTHMLNSGEKLNLNSLGDVVDKHSTGGVGDKTTLIIAPIVAACGARVAKMSGRGLGQTGGTIDKLESIPGFNVNMKESDFLKQVEEIGLAVVSQTNNLVPADKKIYALRDVTGTVESLPLITSSIMSKKLATGANNLVMDIKVGSGALIKNLKDATKLAKLMKEIGTKNNIETICLITNMDIPLGDAIGNALEVKEALEILNNKKHDNLYQVCVELATYMVSTAQDISYNEANIKVLDSIESGKAYKKFIEFIERQGGNLNNLPTSKNSYQIKSTREGYINEMNAYNLGRLSVILGAGREYLEDSLDYGAGIILNKTIGDKVEVGDTLMTLYTNKDLSAINLQNNIFKISSKLEEKPTIIYKII